MVNNTYVLVENLPWSNLVLCIEFGVLFVTVTEGPFYNYLGLFEYVCYKLTHALEMHILNEHSGNLSE